MRIVGCLILLVGAAITVAGCAPQPVSYMTYPQARPSPGIDNVVYGGGASYAPAPTAATYAPPQYAAPMAARAAVPVSYAAPRYAPVAAPASPPPVAPTAPPGALYAYAPAANQSGYTLDSGDRLRIVVFGQEGLTNAYVVDAGGFIDMPLIGPVLARGATTDELAGRIAAKLRDGFIREPHVAVEIEAYRPFFILGEVTQPGQYPYVANMTAETAVAIAGGFTPRAYRKSLVVNRTINGRPMRMAVPLTFPLRPGDTVNVQERWF